MSRFLTLPKDCTLQVKLEQYLAATSGFIPGTFCWLGADALTAAIGYILVCIFHSQRSKHDISPTCFQLLATHTTQVGTRLHTNLGVVRCICLVTFQSWNGYFSFRCALATFVWANIRTYLEIFHSHLDRMGPESILSTPKKLRNRMDSAENRRSIAL